VASELWRIAEDDLDALSLGAAVLGTGGGGSPYIGKLRLRQLIQSGREVDVVSLDAVGDDWQVACVGGIGAPVVGIEKIEHGDECTRALRAVERITGRKVDAVIAAEIGGANALEPMIVAAQTGLPVVDGDGMGRAFPEVQMTTFFIHGAATAPAALADDKGNEVVLGRVQDMYWLERLARGLTVEMGASAGMALAPMSGDFVKTNAVPGTVRQALSVGHTILAARRAKSSVVEQLAEEHGALLLFTGKIVSVTRELRGGFAIGRVRLEGTDDDQGLHGEIDIQNENLVLRADGAVVASVPDLIMVLDADHGEPITTEVLRFGQRVVVIGFPCHQLLRSREALEVVGPAAFGYPDISYRPLSEMRSPRAHHPG
jgi:uncharacterized protein